MISEKNLVKDLLYKFEEGITKALHSQKREAYEGIVSLVAGLEAENDKLLASSLVEAAGIHEDQIKQLKLKNSKQRAEISLLRDWVRDLKTPEQAGEN